MNSKKLSAVFALALSFSLPLHQTYAAQQSVEELVREMRYTLVNEWDSKNPETQKRIREQLVKNLEAIQASGKSSQDILSELKKYALSPQQAKDIDLMTSYILTNKLSKKEANELIVKSFQSTTGSEGTSWFPGSGREFPVMLVMGIVVGGLFVALIVSSIIHCNKNPASCASTGSGGGDGGGDWDDDDDWDDDWDDDDDWGDDDGWDCYEDSYGDLWCY